MANCIKINDLEFIAEKTKSDIGDITYTTKVKVGGSWFKPQFEQRDNFVWTKLPNLDRLAAFYSLIDDDGKDTQTFPTRIKYIHWVDYHTFIMNMDTKITKIKKSAVKLDEADEAYVILKYLA